MEMIGIFAEEKNVLVMENGRDRAGYGSGMRGGRPASDNPDVDKFALCGYSLHELFTNTSKVSAARACAWAASNAHRAGRMGCADAAPKNRYPYERDLARFLRRLVDRCDRKIADNLVRASENFNDRAIEEIAAKVVEKERIATESGRAEKKRCA